MHKTQKSDQKFWWPQCLNVWFGLGSQSVKIDFSVLIQKLQIDVGKGGGGSSTLSEILDCC